jgi:NhaP-type Na+/H+ or K+/H+ antiporter
MEIGFYESWFLRLVSCYAFGSCGLHQLLKNSSPFFFLSDDAPVFEAALGINKRSFNRHIVPILIYAVVGTLIATWLTAFILHRGTKLMGQWCQTIPYVESLTFGALISSIDPIAVLSVLSNMGMTDTDTIYVVIFGESLLNDGVAIVLFQTLVRFLDEELIIDNEAVTAAAIHFLVVFCGSLLVGVGSGMACTVYYWMMHGCQTPLVEGLMFFCWALIPYYICDGIEWSGIVSVVATGFVMDLYVVGRPATAEMLDESEHFNMNGIINALERRIRRPIFHKEGHLSAVARTHIGFVTEILATMMETAIFAYLGIFLFSYRYHWNGFHVVIAILACCVSRGIMIPVLSLVANWVTKLQRVRANCRVNVNQRKGESKGNGVVIDGRMQLILWIAGLRGAMSFALVENIPLFDTVTREGSRLKPELKAMTSATIVFTVFFMGGCTFYMMERVGLAPVGNVSERKTSVHVELQNLLRKDGEDVETESTGRSVDLSLDDATTGSRSLFRQRPAMGRGPSHDSNQISLKS